MMNISVVDYGIGNLFSVFRALEHCGANPIIADTAIAIEKADMLLLPGVGAFADGMAGLKTRNLTQALIDYAASGRHLLAICLGMQMLLDVSEEFGQHKGLGIIPGRVAAIPPLNLMTNQKHKIPLIGWKQLVQPQTSPWNNSILADFTQNSRVYFAHSYCVTPANEQHRLADYDYNGQRIVAAVKKDNVMGCQFHPEKSGEDGLRILKNFLKLAHN